MRVRLLPSVQMCLLQSWSMRATENRIMPVRSWPGTHTNGFSILAMGHVCKTCNKGSIPFPFSMPVNIYWMMICLVSRRSQFDPGHRLSIFIALWYNGSTSDFESEGIGSIPVRVTGGLSLIGRGQHCGCCICGFDPRSSP